MYQRILQDSLRFPEEMSPEAKAIISALLRRDPLERLGVNGADEIKRQPFFSAIDWNKCVTNHISKHICGRKCLLIVYEISDYWRRRSNLRLSLAS
jgi:serine/threonine protein kinase